MWWPLMRVISVNVLLLCASVSAKPPVTSFGRDHQDNVIIAKGFREMVDHQALPAILVSIEERLRSLDKIYSLQLLPTLQDKFDQYHRKLEAIDSRINRLESLVMLNLDKISENISLKNFKDDIAKTNLVKKIDSVYESISHRLSYLDRKYETTSNKIQAKLDSGLTRLEQIEEGFTRREEDIEAELSDAIAAIDDLKTGCSMIEDNIINSTQQYFETSFKSQKTILENHVEHNEMFKILLENTTRSFQGLEDKVKAGIEEINGTKELLKHMKTDIKDELNEYAVKVAEMNSENWKAGKNLNEKQQTLEKILNSTKADMTNGLRALMLVVGKIPSKEHISGRDQSQMEKLNDKLDSNFEKVFTAQNLFMDSCYRLQMDESQIESKISDILEKLMETFEKKTAIEIKDIRNLEKLIRSHDSHITRNLYQTSTNIITVYEKLTKDNQQFETELKRVIHHLSALSTAVRDTLYHENHSGSTKNDSIIIDELKKIQAGMISLDQQGKNITIAAREIREIMEKSFRVAHMNDTLRNISTTLTAMEAKVDAVYVDYYFRRLVNATLGPRRTQSLNTSTNGRGENQTRNIDNTDARNVSDSSELDRLIKEIYGVKATEEITETNPTEPKIFNGTASRCLPNYRDIIDIRFSSDDNTSDCDDQDLTLGEPIEISLNITKDDTDTVGKNSTTDCLPYYRDLIDVRFSSDQDNVTRTNCSIGTEDSSTVSLNNNTRSENNLTQNNDGKDGNLTSALDDTNIVQKNSTIDCLPYYRDLIDVRFNSDQDNVTRTNCSIGTKDNSTVSLNNNTRSENNLTKNNDGKDGNLTSALDDTDNVQKNITTDCLPNYRDLIDVRFNSDQDNVSRTNCSIPVADAVIIVETENSTVSSNNNSRIEGNSDSVENSNENNGAVNLGQQTVDIDDYDDWMRSGVNSVFTQTDENSRKTTNFDDHL